MADRAGASNRQAMLSFAALSLLLASPGCDLPALAPGYRPSPGESLSYDVGFLGAEGAGQVTVAVLESAADGSPRVRVEARHGSLLGQARFRAESILSRGSLRPRRFHDEQDWRGARRTTDADLERSPLAVRVEWRRGARNGMNAYLRGHDVLDFASAVPYLRAADLRPGTPFCFEAVGATRYWRIEGRVAERPELVPQPGGGQEALRLEATMRRADGRGGSVPLRLWIATGPGRLPVAAEAGTPLGRVRVELVSAVAGRPVFTGGESPGHAGPAARPPN